MAPLRTLDQVSFEENLSAILLEVRTILSAKGKSRRRFRVLEIYERGSNELVGEVLHTTHGLVVARRDHIGETGNDGFVSFRQTREARVVPLTGDSEQSINFVSRSRLYVVMGDEILQEISDGKTKAMLASETDDHPDPE